MKREKIMLYYDIAYKNLIPESGHLLIAGTTGAGKSVVINGIIQAIFATDPTASFILIDPKKVELFPWTKSKQVNVYANTPEQIIRAMKIINNVMLNRYSAMEKAGQRKSTSGNIYVIIDELADIILTSKREFLPLLQRVLQLGRAANIKVIAATQAPNRKVIPAELTLNFTDRLALRCISAIESRQIITIPGAEKLPKHGVGLLLNPDGIKQVILPYVNDLEILDTINKLKRVV